MTDGANIQGGDERRRPARLAAGWGGWGLGSMADDFLDSVERWRSEAGAAFEPTLRLGVTGLSRSGKTVFITALAASLLNRDRLRRFGAAAEGRITAAMLQPQPDPDVPRFAFEAHEEALRGEPPTWPTSTRSVSQLRIAIRYEPSGFAAGLTRPFWGASTLNLDIVDYPGEWLMDLPLLDRDYEEWSASALTAAGRNSRAEHAKDWAALLAETEPGRGHDEMTAERLADAWTGYLKSCKAAGLSGLAPGRFLMPGDFEGSPALRFAPLPKPGTALGRRPGSLWNEMRSRYEAYKRTVAKPFFRRHFARLDRQVVLVDALAALTRGPHALTDTTEALADTLSCFRHGRSGWLDRLLGARRIDRMLIAATKADQLHHTQHGNLTKLIEAILGEATRRAAFSGADVKAMALASVRSTAEHELDRPGGPVAMVRGRREQDGREVALHPGTLPEAPERLIQTGDPDAAEWEGARFANVAFRPPRWNSGGPPHIRLDAAIEYLMGDYLG
ncbi:MAG: YcjX family protein [Paracoccaceae bacterium]